MEPIRVGVVGCGAISKAYFTHGAKFQAISIDACADLLPEKAQEAAEKFGVPRALGVDELLDDPDINCVLNLTIPKVHAEVALRAIGAGKHVYSEKPLGVRREEGQQILRAAEQAGVRVGNAPDTFFGAGHQTVRKLIDDGQIGRPVAATAFMMGRGHESWHPNPEFYYEVGGGPMFDMGPYYLTDLIFLLGGIRRVHGATQIAIPERTITSQPKQGKKITVQTPDHVAGLIEFDNGAVGTIITSFATAFPTHTSPITIFGTEGTIKAPDPNGFDGGVQLRRIGDKDWRDVPPTHPTGYGRAVGLADMAQAIRSGRPHRASGELAFAVLDAMQGFLDAGKSGQAHDMVAKVDRPAPLPTELPPGRLDD